MFRANASRALSSRPVPAALNTFRTKPASHRSSEDRSFSLHDFKLGGERRREENFSLSAAHAKQRMSWTMERELAKQVNLWEM